MRKIFLFLSVMLLFLGMTLANPPPVFDLGEDQTEFILSVDQPVDIQGDITAEVYHPAVFTVIYMPATSEVVDIIYNCNSIIDIYGTLLNQENLYLDNSNLQIQHTTLCKKYPDGLLLANKVIDRLKVVDPSRLDIGEYFVQNILL